MAYEDSQGSVNRLLLSQEDDGNDSDSSRTTLGDREATQDDVVMIKERANVISNKRTNETCSQEVRAIFNILSNGDNNNNNNIFAADEEEEEDVVVLTQTLQRYPYLKDLMTKHTDAVMTLFKACDDTGAASCPAASDKSEPKANAWAHALDVCHSADRGSMVKYGWSPISRATLFKKKILDMWKWGIDNPNKVDSNVLAACKRLSKEHEDALKAEKENNKRNKDISARVQQQMLSYQESLNARPEGATVPPPPGARGVVGGGKGQHSTSTRLGQPGSFAYAHLSSSENPSPMSSVTNTSTSTSTGNTKKKPPTPKYSTPTLERGTATIHDGALSSINNLSNVFASSAACLGVPGFTSTTTTQETSLSQATKKRHRTIEKLKEKVKRLRSSVDYLESKGDKYEDEKDLKMAELVATEAEVEELAAVDSDEEN